MNFDPDKLRLFLNIMREMQVDSGKLDGFEFSFGNNLAPLVTTPVPESTEVRYDRLKQELLQANTEQDEIEAWSAS